jgi:hypothetical protein
MSDAISTLIEHLLKGGPEVLAGLTLFIMALLWDRKRLIQEIKDKEVKLDRIVEDYHKGNLTIAEAMYSLKLVLSEIKGRLT